MGWLSVKRAKERYRRTGFSSFVRRLEIAAMLEAEIFSRVISGFAGTIT
ncbi:MAG: hypothetical protein ABDK94_02475 [Atribacterota bacterium]